MPSAERDATRSSTARRATALIREFVEVSEEFEAHVGRELTVNPTDLQAMELLIINGPLSPTGLAHRLSISTAAVTSVVDRLVALGHVRRTEHPTDRRGILVVPTPASIALAKAILTPMITGIDAVLDEFSAAEQAVVTSYLERVLEVYKAQLPSE